MGSISKYLYFGKMKLMVALTYRFEVLTSLSTGFIIILANLFLWKAAYKGIDSVMGVTEDQMITYAIISILLSTFYTENVEHTLEDRISKGDIAVDIFKPINLLLSYFAEDIGMAISALLNKMLPLLLITVIFIQPPMPASTLHLLLFVLSAIISFLIIWLISALVGMLCFWSIQLGNMGTIKDGILLIASGRIVPLWLLPLGIQNVLSFLPFKYVYQTPLSIYIGKIGFEEVSTQIGIQLLWVIIFTAIIRLMWVSASKKVMVQGG